MIVCCLHGTTVPNLDHTRNLLNDLIQIHEIVPVIAFYEQYGEHLLDPARVAVDARNTVSEILTLFAIAFAVKPQRVLSSNESPAPPVSFELLAYAVQMDPNYPRPLQKLAIMYDSRMEFHTSFRIYTNMMTLKNRMDMESLTLNPSKAYAANKVWLKLQGNRQNVMGERYCDIL